MRKEVNKDILKIFFKKRKKDAHKGDYGHLLIIAGNKKYTGVGSLNASAASQAFAGLRSSVDLVTIFAPQRAADIISSFSPDLICYPLKGEYLKRRHIDKIIKETRTKTAILIGGGLGKEKETVKAIKKFITKTPIPGVIDAEGLNAIKDEKLDLKDFILTPHKKEFERISKKSLSEDIKIRTRQVKEEAKRLNTTILLKGEIDIISNKNKTRINKTGDPSMTKGGTGDILAGVCASLLAQRPKMLFESACAAAYITGKAGENTRRKHSLVASDLIEEISKIVDKT